MRIGITLTSLLLVTTAIVAAPIPVDAAGAPGASAALGQAVKEIPAPRAAAGVRTEPQRPAARVGDAQVDNQEYRLGPGDKLRIEVYKDLQLSQSVQVRPDGKITMPLIGDVMASGLAPTELRDQLTAALREYVNNPVVTVIVVEAVASVVFVMGEVSKPGTLSMAGPMTVLQALAMAGGFSTFAKTTDIRIIRRGARGTETIRFNYREAIKDGAVPVFLKRGDLVVVR